MLFTRTFLFPRCNSCLHNLRDLGKHVEEETKEVNMSIRKLSRSKHGSSIDAVDVQTAILLSEPFAGSVSVKQLS